MKIWPPGSVELSCVTPHLKVRWYDPLAKTVAKCYCEKRDLQDKWWDCFYMAVALCPQTEATIKSLHCKSIICQESGVTTNWMGGAQIKSGKFIGIVGPCGVLTITR